MGIVLILMAVFIMNIKPLAFESLGVRSMSTFIETDISITIDPGASLGPKRYGLPPANIENIRLDTLENRIVEHAKRSDVLTVSHYHFDHFITDQDIYSGKDLLVKSPEKNINYSQEKRNYKFKEFLENLDNVKIRYNDDKSFKYGDTLIKFSQPVFHGVKDTKLGYVEMCSINYNDETFVHASDVQGPVTEEALEWIVNEDPDYLVIAGPPTYLEGFKVEKSVIESGIRNINRIKSQTNAKIIVDHHLLRDKDFEDKLKNLRSKEITTAAEYIGQENLLLEAYRKELHKIEEGEDVEIPFDYDQIV